MAKRDLFLVAYDIASAQRLRRVLHTVKTFSTGGQKSVHECFLSKGERLALRSELDRIIDHQDDRVMFLRLGETTRSRSLGIGVPPKNPSFFYMG
jgi:CRISPR-associated protein Cas2